MKIRIQGNSLRLRLSETEVQQFGTEKRVEETIYFGPGEISKLTYILMETNEKNLPDVIFQDNSISIQIPAGQAQAWSNSNQTSITGRILNGKPEGLKILIEKDMDCFHEKNKDS